jgi:hypothetical protein
MMLLAILMACGPGGSADSSPTDPACGDIDDAGTDTGNAPSAIGTWTSTFGANFYDEACAVQNFDRDTETWIGPFTVSGSLPDALYVYFGPSGDPVTERFFGAMDRFGGITISGRHDHSEGTIHAHFGGLVYTDQGTGRDTISGSAFLGLDVDDDNVIDCSAQGDWKAFKSG